MKAAEKGAWGARMEKELPVSSAGELRLLHCARVEKGTPPMSDDKEHEYLVRVPSWDLLRNELGLVLLLFTLPKLKNHDEAPLAFAILSVLVVLSHQMTAVILLFITVYFIINHIRRREYAQPVN